MRRLQIDLPGLAGEQLVSRDRSNNECAHHDLLVVGLYIHDVQNVVDYADDQPAYYNACDLSAAAKKTCPADNRRRNREGLEAHSGVRFRSGGARGCDDPGNARAGSRNDENDHGVQLHADARVERGLRIATECVDVAAELREFGQEHQEPGYDDRNDDWHRYAENTAGDDIGKGTVKAEYRSRVRHDERNAPVNRGGAQRDDERMQLREIDQRAVDRAEQRP